MTLENFFVFVRSVTTWIWSSSLQASILVCLILLCKFVFRYRLSARMHDVIWLLVIVKLLIPWTFESPVSLYNLLPGTVRFLIPAAPAMQTPVSGTPAAYLTGEHVPLSSWFVPANVSDVHLGGIWMNILALIWLLGVIFLALYALFKYRMFASNLKGAALVQDQRILEVFERCKRKLGQKRHVPLVVCQTIKSPALIGWLRPRILLPAQVAAEFDSCELTHIFIHELSHLKRNDIAVNVVMSSLLILHWFNPLLWYAVSVMRRDQEIACDSMALTYMDKQDPKKYGFTLVKLLEMHSRPPQITYTVRFLGYKKHLRRRLEMIKRFRRSTYSWSFFGVLLLAVLAAATLGNPTKTMSEASPFVPPAAGKLTREFAAEHPGIDIANQTGTPVYAAADGVVLDAGYQQTDGNRIVIQHNDAYQTVYAHLETIHVNKGDKVGQGQTIGEMGSTGRSTGPHLYFEISQDGTLVNPASYVTIPQPTVE
ncbi:M56 family metallopeptidase [Brevibacillus sp. B_LB10_24]|uniref:M56 family metallopeptidase n=1 Tax=Brevibacillus sp. B_LB10_24 TaxID=3380645 RepID=UPI0038B8D43F